MRRAAYGLSACCPACGSATPPLLWSTTTAATTGEIVRRGYRCPDCGAKWAVDGEQVALGFLAEIEPGPLALRLEVSA